jgi:hypothetical protein
MKLKKTTGEKLLQLTLSKADYDEILLCLQAEQKLMRADKIIEKLIAAAN